MYWNWSKLRSSEDSAVIMNRKNPLRLRNIERVPEKVLERNPAKRGAIRPSVNSDGIVGHDDRAARAHRTVNVRRRPHIRAVGRADTVDDRTGRASAFGGLRRGIGRVRGAAKRLDAIELGLRDGVAERPYAGGS